MLIYVDIDDTICYYEPGKENSYSHARPVKEYIAKINKLYDEGNTIVYYTARGSKTGIDFYDLTEDQLEMWGCKYHELSVGEKPPYDLMICDKTKRIEEI